MWDGSPITAGLQNATCVKKDGALKKHRQFCKKLTVYVPQDNSLNHLGHVNEAC